MRFSPSVPMMSRVFARASSTFAHCFGRKSNYPHAYSPRLLNLFTYPSKPENTLQAHAHYDYTIFNSLLNGYDVQ